MLDSLTSLYIFDTSTVIAQRYRDEVLELHLRLLQEVAGPDFIFMHGNMKPYNTQFINDFLDEEDIRRINRPLCHRALIPVSMFGLLEESRKRHDTTSILQQDPPGLKIWT